MKEDLLKFIRKYVDIQQVYDAVDCMYYQRVPLSYADSSLHDKLIDLLDEYGYDNNLKEDW